MIKLLPNDYDIGIEWQPIRKFQMATTYTFSNRRYEDFMLQNNPQKRSLLLLPA